MKTLPDDRGSEPAEDEEEQTFVHLSEKRPDTACRNSWIMLFFHLRIVGNCCLIPETFTLEPAGLPVFRAFPPCLGA